MVNLAFLHTIYMELLSRQRHWENDRYKWVVTILNMIVRRKGKGIFSSYVHL